MRELHVVRLSDDGRFLVLASRAGAAKGTHLLEVSERLAQALSGELDEVEPEPVAAPERAPEPEPVPPVESALTPKEIQSRLRSGQSPQRIAKAAGVPLEWVTRFFGPVLSERSLVIEAAQAGTLSRQRRGPSAGTLNESVTANLAEKGVPAPELADWDGYRRRDGSWVIQLNTIVRGRPRRVQWTWVPSTRTLGSLDAYAAALGHRESMPKRAAAKKPATKAAAKKPATKAAAKKTAAKKPAKKAAAKRPSTSASARRR